MTTAVTTQVLLDRIAAHLMKDATSYVRITSLESSKQVVVRINDRGPFVSGRLIDISCTAALKPGLLKKGREQVRVERLLAADAAKGATAPRAAPADTLTASTSINQVRPRATISTARHGSSSG